VKYPDWLLFIGIVLEDSLVIGVTELEAGKLY